MKGKKRYASVFSPFETEEEQKCSSSLQKSCQTPEAQDRHQMILSVSRCVNQDNRITWAKTMLLPHSLLLLLSEKSKILGLIIQTEEFQIQKIFICSLSHHLLHARGLTDICINHACTWKHFYKGKLNLTDPSFSINAYTGYSYIYLQVLLLTGATTTEFYARDNHRK